MGRMGILGDDYFPSDTSEKNVVKKENNHCDAKPEVTPKITRDSKDSKEVQDAVIHFLD